MLFLRNKFNFWRNYAKHPYLHCFVNHITYIHFYSTFLFILYVYGPYTSIIHSVILKLNNDQSITISSPLFSSLFKTILRSPCLVASTNLMSHVDPFVLVLWWVMTWTQLPVHILLFIHWLLFPSFTHAAKMRSQWEKDSRPFNRSVWAFFSNFITLKPFWSFDWYPLMTALVLDWPQFQQSIILLNQLYSFTYNCSGLNLNVSLHDKNRYHRSVM